MQLPTKYIVSPHKKKRKKEKKVSSGKKVQREHLGSPQIIQHLGGKIIYVKKCDDGLFIFFKKIHMLHVHYPQEMWS